MLNLIHQILNLIRKMQKTLNLIRKMQKIINNAIFERKHKMICSWVVHKY